jgi:hypothetical protein
MREADKLRKSHGILSSEDSFEKTWPAEELRENTRRI